MASPRFPSNVNATQLESISAIQGMDQYVASQHHFPSSRSVTLGRQNAFLSDLERATTFMNKMRQNWMMRCASSENQEGSNWQASTSPTHSKDVFSGTRNFHVSEPNFVIHGLPSPKARHLQMDSNARMCAEPLFKHQEISSSVTQPVSEAINVLQLASEKREGINFALPLCYPEGIVRDDEIETNVYHNNGLRLPVVASTDFVPNTGEGGLWDSSFLPLNSGSFFEEHGYIQAAHVSSFHEKRQETPNKQKEMESYLAVGHEEAQIMKEEPAQNLEAAQDSEGNVDPGTEFKLEYLEKQQLASSDIAKTVLDIPDDNWKQGAQSTSHYDSIKRKTRDQRPERTESDVEKKMKRYKLNEGTENDDNNKTIKKEQSCTSDSSTSFEKKLKEESEKPAAVVPPKQDYIHVRARRGQATDSHSLAERARREKISARMKLLQNLVPNCSKVTGKALMLDEIINYVQSLQRQVEFLSTKLAAISPVTLDFNMDDYCRSEIISGHITIPPSSILHVPDLRSLSQHSFTDQSPIIGNIRSQDQFLEQFHIAGGLPPYVGC